jgi:hypothetical protein
MEMKNKEKKKVSNIMLVIVCMMIILYTAANFILQYYTQVEVSPTLTKYWFGFWSAEVIALAGIKISKVIKNKDDEADGSKIKKKNEEE